MTTAVFFGTPMAAVPALASLAGVASIEAVVTRSDKPRGRSGRPQPSPLKQAAAEWGLAVHHPDRLEELAGALAAVDVAVVVAYGRLVPADLLALPRRGFVNVHFSVLPRWRGAAPVAHAILAGDLATGVTLMQMDAGLDTGPIIATERCDLTGRETRGALTARLASQGAALLAATLGEYLDHQLEPMPQIEADATAAPKLLRAEARVRPETGAAATDRVIRGYSPEPGAWGEVDGVRLKLLASARATVTLPAGLLHPQDDRLLLGTGDGAVELATVQPAGKPLMSGAAWARGRRGEPGHLA